MRRSFSREYWFLLICGGIFTLLGLASGAGSGWVVSTGPDNQWLASVLSAFAAAMRLLIGAVLGIAAIRHGIKPYLLLVVVHVLYSLCLSLTSWLNSGLPYALWLLALSILSPLLLFAAAKGLYHLFRGREWLVALGMVLLIFIVRLVAVLTMDIPSGEWSQGRYFYLLDIIKDTLLSGACYALLYLCIRRWLASASPADFKQE